MRGLERSNRRRRGWPLAFLSTALMVSALLAVNLAFFAQPGAADQGDQGALISNSNQLIQGGDGGTGGNNQGNIGGGGGGNSQNENSNPSNEPSTGSGGTRTITVKQQDVSADRCPAGEQVEWHFVINQIDEESNAPNSIMATFQHDGTVTIPRDKFTGGVAHYTYYTPGPDTLITATAVIYEEWDGQFNLSHIGCNRYLLKLEKTWEGDGPEGETTITLETGGESESVDCTAGEDCATEEPIQIDPGDEYSVSEDPELDGWTASGLGNFTFDPDTLQCTRSSNTSKSDFYEFTDITCVHTVTNRAETTPDRDVEIFKQWQGGDPGLDRLQLTVTVGSGDPQTITCTDDGDNTWPCGTLEDVPVGAEVTIEEPDLPEGCQADQGTLSFTVEEDTTSHTVVNKCEELPPPGEQTQYLLQVDKDWDGQAPEGAAPTLTLTVGEQQVSCTVGVDCPSDTIKVEPGNTYSVSETSLPDGWAPDPATIGDFTFDPNTLECVESAQVLDVNVPVTTITCTHTVVNRPQHYEIELVKQWVGGTPPSAGDAAGFQLTAESGENSITCTWNGTALVCDPATLTVEWGDTFAVTESGLPSGWQNQSGLGEVDPADLNCTLSQDGLTLRCMHTVVNELVTEPGEEPERTLTLRKQWIGSGRPDSLVIEVTIGSETTQVTCSGSSSLWTCTPTLDLPADDDATVVIAEPDVPAGWETTSGTGTFTVGELCGNAEDCTHTVVNRREQEREENPPGTPEQPNQPNPPTQPSGPPSPPPISEASPITASPSPTTPVSEAAPATATPPTRVSEASPIVGTPPPQVLPKTGRGDSGSGMLWLLTGLGSLLMATGTGLELHRRSRRSTRA